MILRPSRYLGKGGKGIAANLREFASVQRSHADKSSRIGALGPEPSETTEGLAGFSAKGRVRQKKFGNRIARADSHIEKARSGFFFPRLRQGFWQWRRGKARNREAAAGQYISALAAEYRAAVGYKKEVYGKKKAGFEKKRDAAEARLGPLREMLERDMPLIKEFFKADMAEVLSAGGISGEENLTKLNSVIDSASMPGQLVSLHSDLLTIKNLLNAARKHPEARSAAANFISSLKGY